jgi:hypothetical protein
MCFTGVELAIGSAIMSAVGTVVSSQAQAKQMEYNAKVAEINANTARQQGQYEADRIEDEYQRRQATQRVAALKSGVDPSYGSASLVIDQETARNSWLDQMTSVWNRETQAVGFENKAADLKAQSKSTKIGGYMSAGSSIIGGFGKGGFVPKIA